ncbi:cellulase family glycosylhydrolase [Phototrophicus methaneseepsis]|uniref:Cellulase family glycosylhydrolase n=1 Tax=Phototrophicus methaneseepsis TaxID=2710758 RepID=A0A7S8E6V2_9CHLR|nr:cellulase family glycosylhydrolase [Phototrophicus methaneseepsis]QPC81437.1 cellulase family glycosylhydrolase [Phototrophicus methaneseepsis]
MRRILPRILPILFLLLVAACTPQEPVLIYITRTPQPDLGTPDATIGAIIEATSASQATAASQATLDMQSTLANQATPTALATTENMPTSESLPTTTSSQPDGEGPVVSATPLPTRPGETGLSGAIIDESYTLPPTSTPRPTFTPEPQATIPTEEAVATLPFDVPYLDGRDMGVQLDWNVTEDEWYQWVQWVKPMNVTWVKIQVDWSFVQPEAPTGEPGVTFRRLELYIERLKRNDFKTILSIAKAPGWARPDGVNFDEDGAPSDPQNYANFISLLLQEMGESIDAIEIWNEPNLAREWRGGLEFSGAGYMQLFGPAYDAIRAYSPNIEIITAGLAPTGIVPGETIPDRDYLQQMYAAGLGNYSDINIGIHPFSWNNPPDVNCCTNSGAGFDDQPQFFFLDNVEDLHEIMQQNGHGDLTMWATEFGWPTWDGLPDPPPYEWMGQNTALEQAEYAIRAFEIGQEREELGPMILWNMNFANDVLIENRVELSAYSLFIPGVPIRPLYNALVSRPQ